MAHIILIEPDRVLAEQYTAFLRQMDHTVVPCASAQAAILAADQNQPDAVILELQLIEHSGIEFLYEFRTYAEWQNVPVIVHSLVPPAEFSSNEAMLREQLGVSEYLYKPATTLQQLKDSVNRKLTVKI